MINMMAVTRSSTTWNAKLRTPWVRIDARRRPNRRSLIRHLLTSMRRGKTARPVISICHIWSSNSTFTKGKPVLKSIQAAHENGNMSVSFLNHVFNTYTHSAHTFWPLDVFISQLVQGGRFGSWG